MISIFVLLLFIILLLYFLKRYINLTSNQLIAIVISLFIIVFIINIKTSITSVINGAKLCFYSIFPTIFPFTCICNLLIYYDGISLYSKILGPILCKPLDLSKVSSFALITSIICGYPLGAKYSSELYELKYISKDEYLRLVNIASNCGPLFILGSISIAMLNNLKLGYILLIGNYLSVIIIGILTRKKRVNNNVSNFQIPKYPSNNFGDNFKNAISNALSTTFTVCGFIIIFSIIINILKNNAQLSIIFYNIETSLSLPRNFISSLFFGSIEITNGCKIITSSPINLHFKLGLISFLCSFSGLSIISQCFSFLSKYKVPFLKYFILKLLQGVISFFITFTISSLFIKTIPTSNINYHSNSIFLYILPYCILLVPLIINIIKKKLFIHLF